MNGKKILVVDDETYICEVLKLAFNINDFSVSLAKSAEEALEIIHQEQIPVVFTDLKLVGMNGVELCEKIKNNYQDTIVYAITGDYLFFEVAKYRDSFDNYFTKPFKIEILIKAAKDAFIKIDALNEN